jgi:hypothetical protein
LQREAARKKRQAKQKKKKLNDDMDDDDDDDEEEEEEEEEEEVDEEDQDAMEPELKKAMMQHINEIKTELESSHSSTSLGRSSSSTNSNVLNTLKSKMVNIQELTHPYDAADAFVLQSVATGKWTAKHRKYRAHGGTGLSQVLSLRFGIFFPLILNWIPPLGHSCT